MYLRRRGKSKNPGLHPFGMIGVERLSAAQILLKTSTIHSKDRFVKSKGRKILGIRDGSVVDLKNGIVYLHDILSRSSVQKLSDYAAHQKILDSLIKDVVSV